MAMLNGYDRLLLTQAIVPPTGYTLDEALGSTFSLDLLALVAVSLAASGVDAEMLEKPEPGDALALLEAVRRNIRRFTICCQAGAIHVPREFKDVFLWLEPSVVEVSSPHDNGVFHPKVWLLRFVADSGAVRYRFLCLTRNLTFDRSWDTVLCLEGDLPNRTNAYSRNRPLADFVSALGKDELKPKNLGVLNKDRIDRIADEVLKVDFEVPDGFSEFKFWPIGIQKHQYRVEDLFRTHSGALKTPFGDFNQSAHLPGREFFVVSPFVTNGFVQALIDNEAVSHLVSRADTLNNLDQGTLETLAPPEAERIWQLEDHEGDAATPLSGLHAKLFLANDGWNAHIWTGSANATDAAFGRNIEFLVQLKAQKSRHGIGCLMAPGSPKQRGGFRDLLSSYLPDPENPTVVDKEQQAKQRQLDYMTKDLASGHHMSARVATPTDGQYPLAVQIALGGIAAIKGQMPDIRVRPISLPEAFSQRGTQLQDGSMEVLFAGLSLNQLTEFIVIDVELPGTELRSSAVTRVSIRGMPERKVREDSALLSQLMTSDDLVRYLALLLADNSVSLAYNIREQRRRSRKTKHQVGALPVAIFETLLRGLAGNPQMLDELEGLFDQQNPVEGVAAFLKSDAFLQIWEPFCQARKRLQTL
jgi:hypothetical protein